MLRLAVEDSRALDIIDAANVSDNNTGHPRNCFPVTAGAGMHALRQIGRLALLHTVVRKRLDCEGIDNIDIEASSSKTWMAWMRKLNDIPKHLLRIFRCGAIRSPSRSTSNYDVPLCPHCNAAVFPSARHLVAECSKWHHTRMAILTKCGIANVDLPSLPRCTTKSGWVTFDASVYAGLRIQIRIGVCEVALAIMPNLVLDAVTD